ncbi:hypothetical protein EXIGLDRAFT_734243 [Exidia glandulosa HHB12029]|uniref:DUF6535 domain-containing protein n=1 Tax=Exidia glandulosa HHB12029 TaxID=1314781 RepID=A0A165K8T9_EXIGL|nr:hypothetical protein EXIGLDRAFT_734243 [Exidia glandulosa HHB12029]
MDDSQIVTMGGRFRLFPLATVRDGAKVEPPPKKEYKLMPEPADTDFRKEFPPDPTIGSELDEATRVWKVYRKEAEISDKALLQGWSETLDILLIFAGLFSAVATAFVIESYQFLQLDSTAYAAVALHILVAASNHSTGITLPPPPDLAFKSPLSRWINGLWFTSILLSLTVALLSILAKQWITEYRARNNASAKNPRDWVRRREIYFQALESWPVAEVVGFLPFLLHLSLFLFFAGVVAFLWALDQAIGIWIIVLGGCLGVFYMGCTLVPLWVPESPTSTPLVKQMRIAALALMLYVLRACLSALETAQHLCTAISHLVHSALTAIQAYATAVRRTFVRKLSPLVHHVRTARRRVTSARSAQVVYSPVANFLITCGSLLQRMRITSQHDSSTSSFQPAASGGPLLSSLAQRIRTLRIAGVFQNPISPDTHNPHDTLPLPAIAQSPVIHRRVRTLSERLKNTRDRVTAMHDDKHGLQHLVQNYAVLDASALRRLVFDVSDSDAVAVGLQAIGAMRWDDPRARSLRLDDRLVNFNEELAVTWSPSPPSSTEVLRVVRSTLCMRPRGQRIRPWPNALRDIDYPDAALLHVDIHSLSVGPDITADWWDISPSLASTALHGLRSLETPDPFKVLSCCNFDTFTSSDWLCAFEFYSNRCKDLQEIPIFAIPFHLAVAINTWFSPRLSLRRKTARETVWLDWFLERLLEHVSARDPSSTGTYTVLSTSALDFIASERFLRLRFDVGTLGILTGYFQSEVETVMRDATSGSISQFWGAFACVVHTSFVGITTASLDPPIIAKIITNITMTCAHALRLSPRRNFLSEELHVAVLDATLLPPPVAAAVPQSLWDMMLLSSTTDSNSSSEWLEVAEALAAYLCAAVRETRNTHPAKTAKWIHCFTSKFSDDQLALHALGARQRLFEVFVHLFQHCAELRPDWFSDRLLWAKQNSSGSGVAYLCDIYEEVLRRGHCDSCPAFLGYPATATGNDVTVARDMFDTAY